MIKTLKAASFAAVPYLESSTLMQTVGGTVKFSTSKPNVIVGPNGVGKSALLKSLSLFTLTYYTGRSEFLDKFLGSIGNNKLWNDPGWRREYIFLPGLEVKGDYAPALYYRPGHIPGNETSASHAMMCGFYEEARAFDAKTRHKSSGQKSNALLEDLLSAMRGELELKGIKKGRAWRYGKMPLDLKPSRHNMPWDYQANVLWEHQPKEDEKPVPVVLMDEPEQSLDAVSELNLWRTIESVDCKKLQVIVATHSLYPFLFPKKFNLIEAEPGYIDKVTALTAK
ncbi:ATP-binding protein [Nostoc sp. CHAB 5834]|nr:ATP-binding protein [Nostoc sp. CHAB 5834]